MSSNVEALACTYAALMLSDGAMDTSAENIAAACKAAGVEVRATLPMIFSRFLEKKSIESLMAAAAAVAPSVDAGAAATTAAQPAAAPGADKAKAKEEAPPEDDDNMGFGLFD